MAFFRARKKSGKLYVNADGDAGGAGCELSESTPLLRSTSDNKKEEKESKQGKVSLAKVLMKAYTWDWARANIWKLLYDALVFANPFLLRYVG